MKAIIVTLLIFFLFINNNYCTVFYFSSSVSGSTTDPYCSTTHAVSIKWTVSELNNDYFTILQTMDPDWNTWWPTSGNINGCGTCASHDYVYIDNGPFIEGVKYYYKIQAVGNWGSIIVSGDLSGTPLMFPVPHSKDWKKQTTDNILIGSTSSNRNDYTWHEESNIMQGVRLNLIPPEKVPISKIIR